MQVDEQEALLQETIRKQKLNDAHKKLWEQTESVRQLHARVLLTKHLSEREEQVQLRSKVKALQSIEDEHYQTKLLKKLKVYEAETCSCLTESFVS